MDSGNIFKTIIDVACKLFAYAWLILGLVACIYGLFAGFEGFFPVWWNNLSIVAKITGVFGLIIGFPVSLGILYVLFILILRRSNQLKTKPYNGVLDYIYKHTIPTLITIYGEVMSVLIFVMGVLSVIATVLGSVVYYPLAQLASGLGEILELGMPGGYLVSGSWSNFMGGFEESFAIVVMGLVVLILTYVAKEAYQYACKLVIIFIKFLPRLAIPLSVRKRTIPEDQQFLQ